MKPLILLLLCLSSVHIALGAEPECVNIYYDQSPNASYWMGRTYSIFLQNLLGHFPQFQQMVSPIELYQKGDTEKCRATFYIGSYFDNQIPVDFLTDYRASKKPVVWMGYSLWKYGDALDELFGYQYSRLTTLNSELKDPNAMPTFYKWIDYKGETFFKYGAWSKEDQTKFLAAYEQTELVETTKGRSQVLAWSRHSGTNQKIPYAIRRDNHFYLADVPFSFIHEADRYLVLADLLFDILNVPATHPQKLAVIRIEDVHPLSPIPFLNTVASALQSESIVENISLIPIFYDPLYLYLRAPTEELLTMDHRSDFLRYLSDQQQISASLIWHGITHQYLKQKNPYNGISGSDYEFWNTSSDSPPQEDSTDWVLSRFQTGADVFRRAGISIPYVWLVPHNQASALDYLLFAKLFPWNMGRVIYFNFYQTGLKTPESEPALWMLSSDPQAEAIRKAYFDPLKIELTSTRWSSQYFPYEIYGDVYGQRLIPENLGYLHPKSAGSSGDSRSVDQIIADAKRNLVIRDSWASLFYHPFMLQVPSSSGFTTNGLDASDLLHLVQEIKKLGYQFVSTGEFAKSNLKPIRPEPIYRVREKSVSDSTFENFWKYLVK